LPHIDVLVVAQTQDVHDQIEGLFAKLRTHLVQHKGATAADNQKPPGETNLLIYHVPSAQQNVQMTAAAQIGVPATTDGNVGMGGMGGMGGGFQPAAAAPPSTAVIPEEQLLSLILELIEPESWKRAEVTARTVPGRLLIRHTDEAHKQIQELLMHLGIYPAVAPMRMGSGDAFFRHGFGGGMGGGMGGMGGGGGFF
jgi:hypothetical protein